MAKRSKRYRAADAKIERTRRYSLEEAVRTIAAGDGAAKFDETVELAVKLGVDPRQADQNVRGTVVLPHGTGKSVRVLVLAKGEKAKEATEAGADHVGADDIIKRIQDEHELEGDLRRATVAVLADYRGLTAGQMNRLRKAVREADGRCRVAKNTFVRRAVDESRRPSLEPLLRGPLAMILGFRDPVAIAKL